MLKGLRLYQAIIDRAQTLGIAFEAASAACGIEPELLMSCFEEPTVEPPHDLYDVLTRKRIDAIAAFLECSSFRVFLLADVFKWEDYCLIAASSAFPGADTDSQMQTRAVASYLRSVLDANVLGAPEFIVGEFVSATWSKNLAEACKKAGASYSKLLSWKRKARTPELRDLAEVRLMASAMDMGLPLVMGALGMLKRDDFIFKGQPINIENELDAALDVEIW